MIIREYRCLDCGTQFESSDADPACPHCTGEPERAFFTPPSVNSDKTRRADKVQDELALDFGMSDMTNKHGAAIRGAPSGPNAPQFGGNQKIMQNLAGLGTAGDNFSGVLPSIQRAGNPRTWQRSAARK